MYNLPIFYVPKNYGNGLQIVQDFRKLNVHSHIDNYSVKEISKCIGDIGRAGATIFSALDQNLDFDKCPCTQIMHA